MLRETPDASYDSLRAAHRWSLPPRFNIGLACADHQPPEALALVDLRPDGGRREYTFGDLTQLSNRLANGLGALGVSSGDRVAIVLPQSVEVGLTHLAVYKLGAIAVPLSGLFGPDALRHRLGDSGARVVVTDDAHAERVAEVARGLDGGVTLVVTDGARAPQRDFWQLVRDGSETFEAAPTEPDTPALLIYTSGTTGPAKGALHGHRVLLGHLPGFELSHDFFPQPADRFWTPADWAWIGGLMDALMPTWYHGRAIVAAARERFDPAWALRLIEEQRVRNVFLPPTALKLMRSADLREPAVRLRTIMSGGESLGAELPAWAAERFGASVNEIYGQTEANYVVGGCAAAWAAKPGAMGRPYPGHEVAVLGEDEQPLAPGESGQLAVRVPDPVAFLGYWRNAEATRAKHGASGEWLLTGDLARCDEDGWLWFESRNDDVINSAGYRIGPAEIESCLASHPAIAFAAVVGVPDALRGEAVKAFVQLTDGRQASPALEDEIRAHVRARLAAYLYPREIAFVSSLPMTTTGKIRRADLRTR